MSAEERPKNRSAVLHEPFWQEPEKGAISKGETRTWTTVNPAAVIRETSPGAFEIAEEQRRPFARCGARP
jgi:hypothetical protein